MTIPDKITKIEGCDFWGILKVGDIDLNKHLKSMNDYLFRGV